MHISLILLVLRLGVGIIFLYHASTKFKMWKMQPSAQMSSGMLSLMKFLSVAELLGGLAVLFGVLTQFAAAGLAIIMLGAIYMKVSMWKKTFSGDGGWELDFIILCACITLMLGDAGIISLNHLILFYARTH